MPMYAHEQYLQLATHAGKLLVNHYCTCLASFPGQ